MESSEWHYVFYISVMPTVIQASGNRLMKHPDVLGYLIQCVYQKQTEPSPGFISRLILYQISRGVFVNPDTKTGDKVKESPD